MSFKTWFQSYPVQKTMILTGFIIFGILVSIILPAAFGFAAGAFEGGFTSEFMSKYIFYYGLIFGGIILVIALSVREIILSSKQNNPEDFKRITPFSTIILHDPMEDGLFGLFAKKSGGWFERFIRWVTKPTRLFIVSTIIFSLVGLGSALTNTFFVNAPSVEMQATETAQIYFSAEPAAFGETIIHICLLSIQFGLLLWGCRKLGLNFTVFMVLAMLLLPILGGVEWMGMHILRYGSSETNLMVVFLFGYIGTILTLLTGSFIPWYVWHFWNNAFYKINKLFSDEKIMLVTIAVVIVLIVLWIGFEIATRKKKEDNQVLDVKATLE